jgi:hypothetical protein
MLKSPLQPIVVAVVVAVAVAVVVALVSVPLQLLQRLLLQNSSNRFLPLGMQYHPRPPTRTR